MLDAVQDQLYISVPKTSEFQSGRNGPKHPMLSISMADNVISNKNIARGTTDPRVDFTSHIYSSQFTKLD